MPTRTQPRRADRSAGRTGRFPRRHAESASRFPARPARATAGRKGTPQRFGTRPTARSKKRKSTGLAGMLSGALSVLPRSGKANAKAKGGRSKPKSAFALVAAGVGAALGGREIRRRKQRDTTGPATAAQPPGPTTPSAMPPDTAPPAP